MSGNHLLGIEGSVTLLTTTPLYDDRGDRGKPQRPKGEGERVSDVMVHPLILKIWFKKVRVLEDDWSAQVYTKTEIIFL